MAPEQFVGNLASGLNNNLENLITQGMGNLDNIVGTVTTGFSNIWSGGFAGINTNNVGDVRAAIENYCRKIEEKISTFDENGALDIAFQGKTKDGAREFVKAIKELLQAYVTLMKGSIKELEEAAEKYSRADEDIQVKLASEAQEIRSNAQNIRID